MISEAALTGKPVYIANILPRKNDIRFQRFRNLFRELNITRNLGDCLLYTSPSPRDLSTSRMPSSA